MIMTDKIIVDSRETKKRKKRAEKLWGADNVSIMQLTYGDYVYKDVGIELKTVEDFIGSIKSKRLYNQSVGLNETYNHHYVIVYGDVYKTLNHLYRIGHKFTVKQYIGSLASLSQITNVLHVDNESQAFQLMKSLFEKSTDGKNRKAHKPMNKSKNKMVSVLSLIGDINITRAEKLIDELGIKTLDELIHLTVDDIKSVDGFGDKTAVKIVEYLK